MTRDQILGKIVDVVLTHRYIRRGCGYSPDVEKRERSQLHRELGLAIEALSHMEFCQWEPLRLVLPEPKQ